MSKKKDKSHIYILWTLKVIIQEARSDAHGTRTLILKLQDTSPGYLTDLFISKLIYISV